MKFKILLFCLLGFTSFFCFTSCDKTTEVIIDSSKPQGDFKASRTGTITAQNSTPSAGTVQIGKDEKGTEFVKLGADFITEFGTGTVSVYLSSSATFTASPGTGNPDLRLLGPALKKGETYYKMDPEVQSKFTHLILWCGTAGIPFGNAKL